MLLLGLVFMNTTDGGWAAALSAVIAVSAIGAGAILLFWVVRHLEIGEARLRAIFESTADGILTTDAHGAIESVNSSAVAMFGFRPGQMFGSRVTTLLSSAYHQADDESHSLLDFMRAHRMDHLGVPYELLGLRRNGESFPMDFTVTGAVLDGREVFTIVMRDVSERVEAQAALRRAHAELENRVKERTAELQQSNTRLTEEIAGRERVQKERELLINDLKEALAEIKTLSGMLPICASCKKIRDDKGYWKQIEVYISDHSSARFSHGICPECLEKLYPELNREDAEEA